MDKKCKKKRHTPKTIMSEFFGLVRQARTPEEIALSRAAASGAALALGRLRLMTPERTVDALETIDEAALARSLELSAGYGETLQ